MIQNTDFHGSDTDFTIKNEVGQFGLMPDGFYFFWLNRKNRNALLNFMITTIIFTSIITIL